MRPSIHASSTVDLSIETSSAVVDMSKRQNSSQLSSSLPSSNAPRISVQEWTHSAPNIPQKLQSLDFFEDYVDLEPRRSASQRQHSH